MEDRIKKYLSKDQIDSYLLKKLENLEINRSFEDASIKEQSNLNLSYSIEGNKYDEFKSKYGNRQVPNIPKTWNMSCKSGRGGNKKEHYTYYFSGPSDNLVEVMNSINQFYQGFDYTLI